MSTTEVLLPCPFCGGKARQNKLHIPTTPMSRIYCQDCGATTVQCFDTYQPIKKWNTRAATKREEKIATLVPDIRMGLFMLTERYRNLRNETADKLAKSKFQYRLNAYEELFKKVNALFPTPPKKEE